MVILHLLVWVLHKYSHCIKYVGSQEGPLILEVPLNDQCYVSHFLGVKDFKALKNFKEFIVAFKALSFCYNITFFSLCGSQHPLTTHLNYL